MSGSYAETFAVAKGIPVTRISSISADCSKIRKTYVLGSEFDEDKLSVEVKLTNDDSAVLDIGDYELTGFDASKAQKCVLTVSLWDHSYRFEVKIVEFIYGDANSDSYVTSSDIVRLKKYYAAYNVNTSTSSVTIGKGAYADGNGKVDFADIVCLKKYFAAMDAETGASSVHLGPVGENDGWSNDIR